MPPPEREPLAPLVRELKRYASLDEDDVRAIMELPVRLRRLDAGSYLVREGDLPTPPYRQRVHWEPMNVKWPPDSTRDPVSRASNLGLNKRSRRGDSNSRPLHYE